MLSCVSLLSAAALTPSAAASSAAPLEYVAGTGSASLFVDAAPVTAARPALQTAFRSADQVATLEGPRKFVFTNRVDHRVLEVEDDSIRLLAGNGQALDSSGVSTSSGVSAPRGVAFTGINAYKIATSSQAGAFIRSITLTTIDDGVGINGNHPAVALANHSLATLVYAALPEANIVVTEDGGSFTTVAGNGFEPTGPSSSTTPTSFGIGAPRDVAASQVTDGTVLIATDSGHVWRLVNAGNAASDSITRVAGGGAGTGDGIAATSALLEAPRSVVLLSNGSFLVYDGGANKIRRVSGGTISTLAGNGASGLAPDGTPASIAPLAPDGDMALTPDGLVITQGAAVVMIPATAIVSGPDGYSSSRNASFGRASWDETATYQCALDSGSFGTCADLTGLTDGEHTFKVRATTDGLEGDVVDPRPATRTWTVDATPPSAPGLLEPADGATGGTAFSWTAASDATAGIARHELLIDGVKVAETDSCPGGVCSVSPPEIGDGTHTWQARAVDRAGNVTDSAARTVTRAVPPTAALVIAPSRALVNRTVTFDGAGSADPNGTLSRFEWDLDGNGSFEVDSGATPTTSRAYDRPQTIEAGLRVTDSGGNTATATATLVVTVPPPAGQQLGVSINDGAQYTNDPDVTVHSVWPAFASNMLVSNDGGFKLAQAFPVAETTPWKLDSSGPERLPKTIYVRFLGGLQTSETYQDDIILDETAPKVLAATLPPAGAARASAAAAKRVKLKLRATDNVSGVSRVQVTANRRKPGRFLRYRRTLKVKSARKLFVRARDRAGNLSRWRTAKRRR
jgi:hypothetical protein